ncbi:cytochrome c [Enterovirga sp.]|uniref:c-type cytochrome n=1 Tax=Enterovirga sp. TaxID=2026350 RepID=UPI002BC7F4CA|nr:cytochrome c [Enterovirga sp.]HMO29668.1 cytochrome c [Enterovirga sp.]
MFRFLLTGATVAGIATAVYAQADVIAQRRQVMKGVGAATKVAAAMVKGEKPFDLDEAHKILKVYADAAATFPTYYPEGTRTGGDTTAAPKIWEHPAEFKAGFEAWAQEVQKAAAATTDLATFRASFGPVTKPCKACHESFRIKT